MKKFLFALAGIAAVYGADKMAIRAIALGYAAGLRDGHKAGHNCMLEILKMSKKRESFAKAASSRPNPMPPPMHTEN